MDVHSLDTSSSAKKLPWRSGGLNKFRWDPSHPSSVMLLRLLVRAQSRSSPYEPIMQLLTMAGEANHHYAYWMAWSKASLGCCEANHIMDCLPGVIFNLSQ